MPLEGRQSKSRSAGLGLRGRGAPRLVGRQEESALGRELIAKEPGRNLMRGTAILLLSLAPSFVVGLEKKGPTDSETASVGASRLTIPLSNDQVRELIRQASEHDLVNEKRQRDYAYVKQERTIRRNGKGEQQSVESRTYDVMLLYGEPVEHLTARNGQRLSVKEAAKEEEKIQKLMDERKNESEADRQKRLQTLEKDRHEAREFVREIAEAFDFRFAGVESIDTRETFVIDAEPRPGYRPYRKQAHILTKFRFRVWIDKAETQWVRFDAQFIDTVSFGWFVVRLHPGSCVTLKQARINDEVWLPRQVNVKIDARVALLKNFKEDIDVAYSDYKKVRVDTRILP